MHAPLNPLMYSQRQSHPAMYLCTGRRAGRCGRRSCDDDEVGRQADRGGRGWSRMQAAVYTVHRTQHGAHSPQPTAHSPQPTAHRTLDPLLRSADSSLRSRTRWSAHPPTARCILHRVGGRDYVSDGNDALARVWGEDRASRQAPVTHSPSHSWLDGMAVTDRQCTRSGWYTTGLVPYR